MAAAFMTLEQGDLFKSGAGGAQSLISIPQVDSIVGQGGLAIYSSVSLQLSETIQYFLTFDDVIKFMHFGKGIGTVTVEGILFSDCSGDLPGMSRVSSAISGLRGQPQVLVIGKIPVAAVMTNVQINITGEPDTMGSFIFTFSVVNHIL